MLVCEIITIFASAVEMILLLNDRGLWSGHLLNALFMMFSGLLIQSQYLVCKPRHDG